MKKKLSNFALASVIFLAGGAVGYAGTSWQQMEDAKKHLHESHRMLHEAVKDDHYKHMRKEHRHKLDEAIRDVDRAVEHIDPEHHPRATAKGRVVDLATSERRVIARVHALQL